MKFFEQLGFGAILSDWETGRVLEVNHQAEKLLGGNRVDIVGKKISILMSCGVSVKSDFGAGLLQFDGGVVPVKVKARSLMLQGHSLLLHLCQEDSASVLRA